MMNRIVQLVLVVSAVAAAAPVAAQVPPNGSFENGDFQNWTRVGTGQSNVLTDGDIDNQLLPADGDHFALISNGPGQVFGTIADLDGNGTTDYDVSGIQTQLQFNTYPAYLQFDWSFPTDEEDQLPQYDDVFRVDIDGQAVFGRSSCKPDGGSSPFPAAGCGPGNPSDSTVDGGNRVRGTQLRFGYPDWQRYCQPIQAAVDGFNDLTLRFRVADQTDRQFDSALLVDNVRVVSSCEAAGNITVDQLTQADATDLREKDGSLVYTPSTMRDVVTDADGDTVVFSAGLEFPVGTNTALHQQAFVRRANGTVERITSFTGNDIQHIDVSANGRYLALSARAVEGGARNIYLYDLNNLGNAPIQVTNTGNCDNLFPSVGNNDNRVVFVTECGNELVNGFNPDGNREVVVWNGSGFVTEETSGCMNLQPRLQSGGNRRRAVLVSNCNYDNDNPGGDLMYWRLAINNSITNFDISEVDMAWNHDPVNGLIDISTDGSRVAYLVTDGSDLQVVIVQDWAGYSWTRDRVGFGSAAPTQIVDFAMERDDNPQGFAILRFIPLQGQFALSLAELDDDSEVEIVSGMTLKSPAYAPTSADDRRAFVIASDNLDADETTNGFNQLFRLVEN